MTEPIDQQEDRRVSAGFLEAEGLDSGTVEAVGKLSEAMETVEVARGHLYAFHQLSGRADFQLGDAVDLLRAAGHEEFADLVERQLVGRNVLPGRWTFQMVEEYEATYYEPFRQCEMRSRELTGGHAHLYEASLKHRRRTHGLEGHEARPGDSA